MSRKRYAGLLSMVAYLLMTACAGGSVRGDGAVGGPDGAGKERPGDLYVRLAAEYLRQGQTETALRKANHALVKDPDNPQAHNLVALIYQRLRRDRLAEQHFRKAIGLGPGDPYILNAYASFLCDRRQFAQARSHYEKVLANPRYATPWIAMTNLGICARHSGNGGTAETYFHRALDTNPRFGSAMAALADLDYSRGRHRSARASGPAISRLPGQPPRYSCWRSGSNVSWARPSGRTPMPSCCVSVIPMRRNSVNSKNLFTIFVSK